MIQRSLCGMYSSVYLLQDEYKTFMADLVCKEPGKMLNIFVCEIIMCQLDLEG